MVFSKLRLTAKVYSTWVKNYAIIRSYSKNKFRPFITPKDQRVYLLELQKQRTRLKAQTPRSIPSKIHLKIIGNGSHAENKAVLLVTDNTHYLFNCGEGTQRLFNEHISRLTQINHIFITRPSWKNFGGLPGVTLTIQNTGVSTIQLHGPKGLIDIIEATKNFVTLDEMKVVPADTDHIFRDHVMAVTYVEMKNPKVVTEIHNENNSYYVDNSVHTDINYYDYNKTNIKHRTPNHLTATPPRLIMTDKKRIDSIMAYICKIHPKPGMLNLEKCVDAGIKPGPDISKLRNGEDVILPNNIIVKSKDVFTSDHPGSTFIVAECPNEDYLDIFVQNPSFIKYEQNNNPKQEDRVNHIIHFTPDNILYNPKYQEWMRKFGSDTEHIIVNESNQDCASEAMHKMQHQLHLVHPTIFPFFENQQSFSQQNSDDLNKKESIANNTKIEDNENNLKQVPDDLIIKNVKTLNSIHLRPLTGFEPTNVCLNPEKYVKRAFNTDGFLDALAEAQTEVNAATKFLDNSEYPKLLMLGTGSSVPNKIRNTSGMLLQLDEDRSIILDCGEGTSGQIIRFFGVKGSERIFKSIKAIYISHLHADHHLGLIGILKHRERFTNEHLFVLAPQQIASYLNFYHNRFESITNLIRLVSNRDILQNKTILSPITSKDMYNALGIENISTCFVTHCPFAYGVTITLKNGQKIAYSGDTIPCNRFVELAKHSDLLIHEATMEDGLEHQAVIKRHSTISQAINIGIRAEAKFTLLTHFSQRYSKLPMLPDKDQSNVDFSRIGVAFDFMHVSLSQLKLLPIIYPCIEVMFQDFKQKLNDRASKREWLKEQTVKASASRNN
uniref:Zinc phosphodiesterase ELAC protein 2 n=1 Tax=Trichogramma kaykai TaxID=54128 RepID=A0ABD2W668_9HYME